MYDWTPWWASFDNHQELKILMEAWLFVTSNMLDQAAIVMHCVSTMDLITEKQSIQSVTVGLGVWIPKDVLMHDKVDLMAVTIYL